MMKNIYKFKWVSILVLVILLVGCGNAKDEEVKAPKQNSTSYSVVDDRGVKVTFEKVPETVISLQPSNTEILFALGMGDRIVGATDFDKYPAAALEIERVSDALTFNSERIVALNPDVVFAYSNGEEEAIKALENTGVKVFVIKAATTFEDVYGDIKQIAQVMDVEDKGAALNGEIQGEIADVQAKVATVKEPKNVYYEISAAPELWTAGEDTFQQEVLTAANVKNIFSNISGWAEISEEQVITANPELILTTVNYLDDPISELLGRAGWETVEAIQNKNIVVIDGEVITRPGPRIGEAVELVAKAVYPDLFK